jgi:hypothetical protein
MKGFKLSIMAFMAFCNLSLGLNPSSSPLNKIFSKLYPAGSGESISWGVLKTPTKKTDLSDEERAQRRVAAAKDLVNIDDEERARRKVAGQVLAVVTCAVAAALPLGHVGFGARVAAEFPLAFLAKGYLGSAKQGL